LSIAVLENDRIIPLGEHNSLHYWIMIDYHHYYSMCYLIIKCIYYMIVLWEF
jgi:hypothetical protein